MHILMMLVFKVFHVLSSFNGPLRCFGMVYKLQINFVESEIPGVGEVKIITF